MTVQELILKLQQFPPETKLVCLSNDPEKMYHYEGVYGLHAYNICSRRTVPLDSICENGDGELILQIQTGMRSDIDTAACIEKLREFTATTRVVYCAGMYSFEERFKDITELRQTLCAKYQSHFHDMMDHADYTDDVYGIDCPSGENRILITGVPSKTVSSEKKSVEVKPTGFFSSLWRKWFLK